jgi:hypothetical protein
MAPPSEKLARALEALETLQQEGKVAIRSTDLSRVARERLCKNGFLQEVMKGWYIPSRPDETSGESTAWYASFWGFCGAYLKERFKDEWSLSPEQSLSLLAGNQTVPQQLLIRSQQARSNKTRLLHGTSILEIRAQAASPLNRIEKSGLYLFSLSEALIACAPGFFRNQPMDARIALSLIQDASELLPRLLDGGHSTIAGRLAGAFRNIGRERIADEIVKAMRAADYVIREQDPFETPAPLLFMGRERSPYVTRLRLMWQEMREPIPALFPAPPGLPMDTDNFLSKVEEVYLTDAYHSLSIEGYLVNRQLIERVRLGTWNPEGNESDLQHRNALAARGYWQAYQAVRESLKRILKGESAGLVADEDHGTWYRELFAPSVSAGILKASDLSGYRNDQVFIRRSMHVPPAKEAVRDLMPTFFELLQDESEPAVRVVLGHFMFVYIHPYMDGNGRMGRFLMNTLLASGGYPWTIVPVEQRARYLDGLEAASAKQDIRPFCSFLGELVTHSMNGLPDAHLPLE